MASVRHSSGGLYRLVPGVQGCSVEEAHAISISLVDLVTGVFNLIPVVIVTIICHYVSEIVSLWFVLNGLGNRVTAEERI